MSVMVRRVSGVRRCAAQRLGAPVGVWDGGGYRFEITHDPGRFPGLGEFFPPGAWDGKADSFFTGTDEMVNYQIALLYARGYHTWRPWERDAVLGWMIRMGESPEGLVRVVETFALAQRLESDVSIPLHTGLDELRIGQHVPANHWQSTLNALFGTIGTTFGANALAYAWHGNPDSPIVLDGPRPSRDALDVQLRLFQLLGYLNWQGGTRFNPDDFYFEHFHFDGAEPPRFYVNDVEFQVSDIDSHIAPGEMREVMESYLRLFNADVARSIAVVEEILRLDQEQQTAFTG